MQNENTTHTTSIPLLHALLWGIGLLAGLFGILLIKDENHPEQVTYLFSAYIVFTVFLFELALVFADLASVYSDERIKGNVFWVFCRLFIIIPLTFVLSFLYYKIPETWLLIPLAAVMAWLKWESVHLNNNMGKFVIKIAGFNFGARKA